MSGDDELTVLEKIKDKTEIRDALDWERYENTDKASTLMPPKDSVQYEMLIQAHNEHGSKEEALQQMRDTVPGMFGF
jgi:hypothetical protein